MVTSIWLSLVIGISPTDKLIFIDDLTFISFTIALGSKFCIETKMLLLICSSCIISLGSNNEENISEPKYLLKGLSPVTVLTIFLIDWFTEFSLVTRASLSPTGVLAKELRKSEKNRFETF